MSTIITELAQVLTPQNFAMIVTVYLLIRFEGAINNMKKCMDDKIDELTFTITQTNRLISIMVFKDRDADIAKEVERKAVEKAVEKAEVAEDKKADEKTKDLAKELVYAGRK